MIGEGLQSTNQRRHSFVEDRVEVGFFTDPSVCIGCKACEVACKEWNEVPDDGFIWSETLTTIPAISALRPGDTSSSSSRIVRKEIKSPVRCR